MGIGSLYARGLFHLASRAFGGVLGSTCVLDVMSASEGGGEVPSYRNKPEVAFADTFHLRLSS